MQRGWQVSKLKRLDVLAAVVLWLTFAGVAAAQLGGGGLYGVIENFSPSSASSDLIPAADNTYDIGSTSLGWKDLNLSAGGALKYSGRTQVTSPANGNLLLRNNAGTDFGLLQLGGTTSSFGAIKKFNTSGDLEIRAADDSGPRDLFLRNLRAGPSATTLKIDFFVGSAPQQLRFATDTSLGFTPNANAGAGGVDSTLTRVGVGILSIGGATPGTTGGALQMQEMAAAPAAPAADGVRIYAKDDGGGKTQLCARFATGAEQCFATEP
jgi:hypothetical protein